MSFFGQKWKWILKSNEKFALWKCLYFYSKMHWDQDISLFIFFSSYPFGGILDTLPLLRFWFRFFCFFTNNQPQIYLSVTKLFSKKIVFWYALMWSLLQAQSFLHQSQLGPHWWCKKKQVSTMMNMATQKRTISITSQLILPVAMSSTNWSYIKTWNFKPSIYKNILQNCSL